MSMAETKDKPKTRVGPINPTRNEFFNKLLFDPAYNEVINKLLLPDYQLPTLELSEKTRDVKDFYDSTFAKNYDPHMEETGHYAAMRRLLDFIIPNIPRGLILDPACGTGEAISYILSKREDLRFIANDFSPAMLAIAFKKLEDFYPERVLFTQFDAQTIPFKDDTFGTILLTYTMHWFEDKLGAAENLHRILRPGGALISIEEWPLIVSPSQYSEEFRDKLLRTIAPMELEEMNFEIFFKTGFCSLIPRHHIPIDEKHEMRLAVYGSRLKYPEVPKTVSAASE